VCGEKTKKKERKKTKETHTHHSTEHVASTTKLLTCRKIVVTESNEQLFLSHTGPQNARSPPASTRTAWARSSVRVGVGVGVGARTTGVPAAGCGAGSGTGTLWCDARAERERARRRGDGETPLRTDSADAVDMSFVMSVVGLVLVMWRVAQHHMSPRNEKNTDTQTRNVVILNSSPYCTGTALSALRSKRLVRSLAVVSLFW
jgi:hypothetical protein